MNPNDNYLFHCSHCGYYMTNIADGNSQYDELLERWGKNDKLSELWLMSKLWENEIKTNDDSLSHFRLFNDWFYCPHCGRRVNE